MDRDEVEVHKLAKKRTRPISSHLDRTNLVNKGFIIWLLVKFCSRDTAGSPERARWLHLARSGSQSKHAIWFILPAHGASHIIMKVIAPSRATTRVHVAWICADLARENGLRNSRSFLIDIFGPQLNAFTSVGTLLSILAVNCSNLSGLIETVSNLGMSRFISLTNWCLLLLLQ